MLTSLRLHKGRAQGGVTGQVENMCWGRAVLVHQMEKAWEQGDKKISVPIVAKIWEPVMLRIWNITKNENP